MKLSLDLCFLLVLVNGLCHGQGRPYADSGYYAPASYSLSEYAKPRTISHGLSSLKNDEAKSRATAVLAHNVMPTPANQFDRDLVAASHSLAFVVRDPGLQHQDIVSFLANEKRLSQHQKPVAKTDTYMYEFWQNTQLPVVHWMPLGASDTDHQQANSWKSLPEQQQLVDHTQQSHPVSTTATTPVPEPAARVPLTLPRPLNQNSPFSNGSKTLKKKRICRRPGVCRGMATRPQDVGSATISALPAYVDTTEPIATSFPKFQFEDHTQMISTTSEPEATLSYLKKQPSTSTLESTTSESTLHPLDQDTRTENGKVDLLAQWPFNAMRNVSKFRSRVRPYHRRQDSYKVASDSSDAPDYTSSSPLKGQSSDTSIAEVANLDNVEDSSSRQEMETTVNQSKSSLSSLFPRHDPSRLSYAEILRNKISVSQTEEQNARPGIIKRRLPSRSTTPSPKHLSILRSVRPNSTYPLRHGSSSRPFLPSRKTTGSREKTVDNKSKRPNSGKLVFSSKSNSRFPAHRHLNQPSPFNRKSSSLDDPISESDTSSLTEEPNFSTIPSDRFHDDLFRQDEYLDTMTENATPGTNQTTSTSDALFTIHQTSTEAPPTTTTKQSDIPQAQSSISQVMQIRSESRSEIHVKQTTEQLASRDTNNPVKPHTDSATRVSKAVNLFNDSDKNTETKPSSISDILVQPEPKSISDRQAPFLILQAPTRRPTIFKGNVAGIHPTTVEATLPSSPTFLNESRTVFSSTTLATILPPIDSIMDKITPLRPTTVVTTLPKISTVLAERTVFISPDTIATTRLPSSTTLQESITLPSSTTEATTLFPVSNRMEERTISYRLTTDAATLAAQEAQTPYPFAIRTTESTNPHRLAVISRKSAIASNLRRTPSSTTALQAVENITTIRSATPGSLRTTIPTTTTLSPRAGFLEMLRTAVSHRLENKPVSRSRSYASIVIQKPSAPILNSSLA